MGQTIVRTTKDRNNPYVMINKDAIGDVRLSWKARGILAYLLSKPNDWKIILEHLEKQSPDGKTSLRSGIDELKKYGYIVRVAVRKNNKIDHWEFWVNETPLAKPIEKYVHINGNVLDELEKRGESQYIFTEEGKTLDPALLSENRNLGKTRLNTLDSENLNQGNQDLGNKKLLNNDITNDDDSSAMVSQPWEKDFQYMAFRQQFTNAGASDIRKHEAHYSKFLDAKEKVGYGKLCELAEAYIKQVKAGKHEHKDRGPQIVWFLDGGWQNNFGLDRKKIKSAPKKEKKEQPRRKLKIVDAEAL